MAYRAEIEIGIRGAARLKDLQNRLNSLSTLIDENNSKPLFKRVAIQSVQQYSDTLALAKGNLNKVQIELDKAGKATGLYAKNIKEYAEALVSANDAQNITNRLVKEEVDLRTQATAALKAYNAAAVPPTQRGAQTTMAGAYLRGQPNFGPQPAPDFNPLAAAGRARASGLAAEAIKSGQAAQEAIRVINEVTEYQRRKFIDITNTKIQLTQKQLDAELDSIQTALDAAIKADKAKQADFDRRLSARTRATTEAEQLYLQIRQDSEKRIEAQRKAGLERIKKLEQDIAKERENRARRRQEALGSALIGGGFPLLFGQGPGAALGGALGGGAGGLIGGQFGFGLSLIGTQLGTTVDEFIKSTAELGQALDPLTADIGALATAAGFAGTEIAKAIEAIEQLGSEQEALEAATLLLAATVGNDGVNALRNFGDDTADLGREFERTMALMQAAAAKFFGGVASFVGGVLQQANDLQAGLNLDTDEAKELQARRTEILKGSATSAIGASGASGSSSIAAKSGELLKIEGRLRELARERRLEAEGIVLSQAQELKDKAFLEKFGIKSIGLTKVQNKLAAENKDFTNENYVTLLKQEALEQRNLANKLAVNAAEKDKEGNIKNYGLLAKVTNQNEIAYNNTLLDIDRQRDKALDSRIKKQNRASTKAATEANRLQQRLAKSALGREALPELTGFKDRIAAAEAAQDKLTARRIKGQQAVFVIEQNRLKSLIGVTSQQEIDEINLTAAAQKVAARRDTERDTTEILRQRNELFTNTITGLQSQLDIATATTREEAEQLRLREEMQKLRDSGDFSEGKLQQIELMKQSLIEAQQPLNAFITQSTQALNDFEQVAVTVSQGVGDAFGAAMTTGLSEVVAGTKSAEEVFADFLRNIANVLLQAAAQMIATYIAIGVARMFAGVPADGGGSSDSFAGVPNAVLDSVIGARANGGPVASGNPYIIGERGPELFVPRSNGRIVPNGRFGGGGGGDTNVVVNVDAKGSSAQGNEPNAKALGAAIGAAVQSEIIKQKRPGGLLA